ncbi:uncharacterized protein LOC126840603 [Adelges cooleyi]|uniref:uncharacterized protein LOC126840603 n=1 Tax=Adelges cooleyi TaxID=133065 RepID=UPI00218069F3|nr:uncharacterized protein LOC126840603 [Adelges cooleyi]
MFLKLITLLTYTSIVNCTQLRLIPEDKAILNAFIGAMDMFDQDYGLEMEQFLMLVGDDNQTKQIIAHYFEINPHARKQTDNLGEELFFDLVYALSNKRPVPVKELTGGIMKIIKKHNDTVRGTAEKEDKAESSHKN